MKTGILAAIAATSLIVASCSDSSGSGSSIKTISLTRGETELMAEQTSFSTNLFNEAAKNQNGNFVISPLSASCALGMMANGASGNYQTQLVRVLSPNGADLQDLNSFHSTLLRKLPECDKKVDFLCSNALWIDAELTPDESFIAANNEFYSAATKTVSFSNEAATIAEIQKWAAECTGGVIDNLSMRSIGTLNLMTTNATYFNAGWSTPFDVKDTKKKDFRCSDGSVIKTDMMSASGSFVISYTEHLTAAVLPYAGGAFRMIVIVPLDENDHTLNSISDSELKELRSAARTYKAGTVLLPRFEISSEILLFQYLRNLGVTADPELLGVSAGEVVIGDFQQVTKITVSENGTKAASVTYEDVNISSNSVFAANRPFIFLIEETSSEAILMIGKVNRPD